ncbi:glycosyltransferase family 1 protein [Mucilaginibacter sp. PAMB04274]|uniref:glycosyltransferase family 4 protein n=1 Tax=Mucilaginibacter sp. PAMB04274 TaxID=3138568 RepID=UPI0031F62FB4
MPKIVIDGRMISSSGIGTYLSEIVKSIKSNYTVTDKVDDVSKSFHNKERLSFVQLNVNANIYSLKEQVLLPKNIPSCDVFWSPHYNVPVFPVRARKRLVTIHDVYHLHNYEQLTFFQKMYVKTVMYAAVYNSDKIITVSAFSKNEILKYYECDPDKILVIHNGVEQQVQLTDVNVVKAKYKLPEHYILFVGNVKPHKNLNVLIEAYLKLSTSIQDKYKIVIVGRKEGFITGDQSIFNKIQNNSILQKSILFTGYVNQQDMDSLYTMASVFVFPSFYEGFGLPPLEAMKCSCPVIVSDIPSHQEVCNDAALYFDPLDSSKLALLLKEVLTDDCLRKTITEKGAIQIKKFTWKSSYDKHIQVFNDLLS